MEQDPEQNAIGTVLQEVQELRREISVMQRRMGLVGVPDADETPSLNLSVYFDAQIKERKPYLITFGGSVNISLNLSSVRTAVFLIYLLDLEDRLDGGRGIADKAEAVLAAYQKLEKVDRDLEAVRNSIRVAMYRFQFFIEDKFARLPGSLRLSFDNKRNELVITTADENASATFVDIQISANDAALSSVIDSNLTRTPLARVKKRGALHVPAGYGGVDDLLLGFYDHPHRLQVTSLYVRPTFTTYPDSLLRLIGVADKTFKRKELSLNGYREGRFHFLEILNSKTLEDLGEEDDTGKFKYYPETVERHHICEHLDSLAQLLESYSNFKLYLTEAVSPFVVVTYKIEVKPVPEFYTVFFQQSYLGENRDLECFVIQGAEVYRNMHDHVIGWLLSHPTTITDKGRVISRIESIRQRIASA